LRRYILRPARCRFAFQIKKKSHLFLKHGSSAAIYGRRRTFSQNKNTGGNEGGFEELALQFS